MSVDTKFTPGEWTVSHGLLLSRTRFKATSVGRGTAANTAPSIPKAPGKPERAAKQAEVADKVYQASEKISGIKEPS